MLTSWSLIWLVVAVLLVAGGALNLSQRATHDLPPTDGVLWVQRDGGIYAEKVTPGLAASRAGISQGDRLLTISLDDKTFDEVVSIADIPMYLDAAGVGGTLTYYYQKTSYSFANNFYYADLKNIDTLPRWTPSIIFLTFVGLIWLGVGLFVLFKQGSRSPFVLHFAMVCLAAFVFHVYRSLNLGQDLDLAVNLLDDIAFAFFAPLFLHFCLRYPVHSDVFDKDRWKTIALYIPAAVLTLVLLTFSLGPLVPIESIASFLKTFAAGSKLFPILNSALLYHFVAGISIGASVLLWRFLTSPQAMVRQRLKWAMWGTIFSIVPILIFQIARRFVFLPDDTVSAALTTLPLALIPLSFGHSVVRYRLMDVELVVRRAAVYAFTTLAITVAIGSIVYFVGGYASGGVASSGEITLRLILSITLMAVIVMIAAPVKNFMQERVDRIFYGRRYDLRHSLLDFGRTISATTALDPLLDSLIKRLREVMNVERLAIFIEDQYAGSGYRVARTAGLSAPMSVPADFREMIRTRSAETGVVRADDLDTAPEGEGFVRRVLHYYVPCVVRGRMVAVIGLGRTADGALLTSEDVEILRTVSGYIAVAIENSLLYQEQTERATELEILKEFNESIVESINVGLMAVDLDGRITRLNSALEEIFAIGREEAIDKRVEELFAEDFADVLRQVLGSEGWKMRQTRQIYKLHTATRAGRSLTLNVALAPLWADSAEQTGALVVFEDVTERLHLEEQLQQREKLSSIGLLAAGVAHEVNTPLTGVSSYTQMLLNMLPENDPKHALLEKVRRQADRATDIVNNLLNFSRTGGAAEFSSVDVHRVLDDTLQLLEPQLRRSQIEIIRDYGGELPQVHANAVKLQQVFTNLILNARDSIANGDGRITLATRNGDEGLLTVEVADNGVGIAPDDVAKIYDPFFTTKGVGRGTGLGLAVTYGIVQEHSGHISVSSTPGTGTTFRITLPTRDPRARLAAAL